MPRILHIGNIANNAFINAKLLRDCGVESDVLCNDYYHMMGCPEWEDADFKIEDIGNQFMPNWRTAYRNGYNRPEWFVQGPLRLALPYMIARAQKQGMKQSLWQWVLSLHYRIRVLGSQYSTILLAQRCVEEVLLRWHVLLTQIALNLLVCLSVLWLSKQGWINISTVLLAIFISLAQMPFVIVAGALTRKFSLSSQSPGASHALIDWFHDRFPERQDSLSMSDIGFYSEHCKSLSQLFEHYDAVIGYATSGIYPLLATKRPYYAFEHGTLRSLPFEQSMEGRLTALTYAQANHVFVTNSDCISNAEKLNPGRVTFINHPYDVNHGEGRDGGEELREELTQELSANMLAFFPTRHDWVKGTGYADKANDIFFRAVKDLKQMGVRIGVICAEWGANVQQSKSLIDELDIADQIKWVGPMGTVRFEMTVLACDILVDQFLLGSFGGVLFKAMGVGCCACTYLDMDKIEEKYGEAIPCLNCRTQEDIKCALFQVYNEPQMVERIRAEARAWMLRYHHHESILQKQLAVFSCDLPVT